MVLVGLCPWAPRICCERRRRHARNSPAAQQRWRRLVVVLRLLRRSQLIFWAHGSRLHLVAERLRDRLKRLD
jgi:hypothetical protein